MMQKLGGLVVAGICLVGCASAPHGGESLGPDEAAVAEVVRAWENAWLACDVDKVLALTSERFVADGFSSRESLAVAVRGVPQGGVPLPLDPDRLKVRVVGDHAVVNSYIPRKAGQFTRTYETRPCQLVVLREDGQWRVSRYSTMGVQRAQELLGNDSPLRDRSSRRTLFH